MDVIKCLVFWKRWLRYEAFIWEISGVSMVTQEELLQARILIVDDQLDISLTLSAMLQELAEVNLSIVVDGQETLDALREATFDILFLDLDLPLATGEEVLDAIAAGEHVQKPRHIIAMSAGARLHELQGRVSSDLIAGLLKKPFQYDDLQGIIAEVPKLDAFALDNDLSGHDLLHREAIHLITLADEPAVD